MVIRRERRILACVKSIKEDCTQRTVSIQARLCQLTQVIKKTTDREKIKIRYRERYKVHLK